MLFRLNLHMVADEQSGNLTSLHYLIKADVTEGI